MPSYNSLGVSASLSVTKLDGTVSNDVMLRMGTAQQEIAGRVDAQISKGRALPERPCRLNGSKVGVIQFVGVDQDMALFVVETGDTLKADGDAGSGSQDASSTEGSRLYTAAGFKPGNISLNMHLDEAATQSQDEDAQYATSSTSVSEQAKASVNNFGGDTTALSIDSQHQLRINCAKFLQRRTIPSLASKDLKFELFLNGKLVEATYELLHTGTLMGKSNGLYRFSGTRFHRKSEKPWIYTATAELNGAGSQSRWNAVSRSLAEEASARGMDKSHQRPPSAQLLDSLAQIELPAQIESLKQKYSVLDLIITAGKGKKYGPASPYTAEPTRFKDTAFKYVFVEHAVPDLGPFVMQNGEITLQSEDPAILDPNALFLDGDNSTPPLKRLDDMPSSSYRTPTTPQKSYPQTYHDVLQTSPVKKALLSYENSRGFMHKERTLRQRLGDMVKMSPKRKREIFTELQGELDDQTTETLQRALEREERAGMTPTRKKVRFNLDEDDYTPVDDNEGSEEEHALTEPPELDLETSPSRPPTFGRGLTASRPGLHAALEPDPTLSVSENLESFALPKTPKRTKASALTNSLIKLPVKRRSLRVESAGRKAKAKATLDSAEGPETGDAGTGTAPQHAPHASSSDKKCGAGETLEQALENFQIPELCVGSTLTYPGGKTQRQVNKARGGVFHEEQLVLAMRFIVR